MKTIIELKGDEKQVKTMALAMKELASDKWLEFGNYIKDPEYTKFNQYMESFIGYQTDRFGKSAKAFIKEAKKIADKEGWKYDEVEFIFHEDYEENLRIYSREENEKFTIEEGYDIWKVYSNKSKDDKAAMAYKKKDYTFKQALYDYKKNGTNI